MRIALVGNTQTQLARLRRYLDFEAEILLDDDTRATRNAPLEVDAIMRQVPKGKLITIDDIRRCLAEKHRATIACPITTGIFAWIAAHAADKAEHAGQKKITPYWRTLKTAGQLNPKYPGGIDNLVSRLRAEGHSIQQKGSRYLVPDYAQKSGV